MKPLKIVLDVQHMGKPHNPLDRGAVCGDLIEANLCLEYASIAYKTLTVLGHHPFLLTHGYYGQRAAFANQIGTDLYLALHLNSAAKPPKTHYALVEISEYAWQTTFHFAQHLANIFGQKLPVAANQVGEIWKNQRGWSCINRVAAPALILEPCFINHSDSRDLLLHESWKISAGIVGAIKTFDWGV